jgi:hypothetical protein
MQRHYRRVALCTPSLAASIFAKYHPPIGYPAKTFQQLSNCRVSKPESEFSMTSKLGLRFRQVLAASALSLLFGVALSAQTQATGGSTAPPAAWTTYTYSADGFSVSFPIPPQTGKQDVPTEAGSFELRTYLATPGSAALYVGVCDYGSAVAGRDPQTVLKGAKEGAIANVKAHITNERQITLGVYPGVEFEAENDTLYFKARIYLVGTTLYQALTAAPLADKYADTTKFLDSFQLIPRDAK